MVLLDTCALLWWTLKPERLSPAAAAACEAALFDGIVISSISFWEIGIKVKKRKLVLPVSVSEYVSIVEALDRLEVVPVTAAVWLANLALKWDNRDPSDRTIVATAQLRGIPIVTADSRISSWYRHVIW